MSTDASKADMKYSVYIALIVGGAIAMYDLTQNGSIEASKEVVIAFLGFAGLRQAMKSFLKK